MTEPDYTEEEIEAINNVMAHGALKSIRDLLDSGGIPRGTFPDEQVRNLVVMYNEALEKLDVLQKKVAKIDELMRAHWTGYLPGNASAINAIFNALQKQGDQQHDGNTGKSDGKLERTEDNGRASAGSGEEVGKP